MTKTVESEWIWVEGLHAETGEWIGLYNFDRNTGVARARDTLKALLDLDDDQLLAKHGLSAMLDFRIGGIGRDSQATENLPNAPQSASKGSKPPRPPNGGSEAPTASEAPKKKRCREKHPKKDTRCIKKLPHKDLHRDLEGRRW